MSGSKPQLTRLKRRFESLFETAIAGILVQAPALESARLHAALRESELRQSALVEAALDCIIATDSAGVITEFNPAAEKTFGYRAQEVLGRPLTDLVEDSDSQLLKEEGPMPLVGHRNEGQGVRRDGSRFPVEVMVTGLADPARPLILVSVRDLTPIQLAETARRENEAKSRFLATMSHELRTPLNSVLGFTQLLEAEHFGPLNDRQRRYLRNIAGSGQHLLRLINDVLDLSKVQAGEMELAMEPFDLDEVLAQSVEQMLPQARAKSIRLENEAALGRTLAGDRRRVFQIMLNLISNALKFTSEGGAVTVGGSCGEGKVLVTVRDNGVGIPGHLLDRVFEEFTQVESGTTRNQEGTGLGLALSRRLAELMGGGLEVESEPGTGSVFTLELPLPVGAPV